MASFSMEQARQILRGKDVVVIGDSGEWDFDHYLSAFKHLSRYDECLTNESLDPALYLYKIEDQTLRKL